MIPKPKISILAALLTFFVDCLAWAIVFPIFAPFFLNTSNPLFSPETPETIRTLMFGLFLMIFSFGQFLGAPLVGDYADRFGRKNALLITISMTFLGISITAIGVKFYSLFLLFLGRFFTGVFASNGSICLASVSDLSPTQTEKTKNFGYFSIMAGIAFIVGALAGGKLSDPHIFSWGSPDLPLWFAAFLCACNGVLVAFGFKETLEKQSEKKFSILSAFRNIKTALSNKNLHASYIIYFLFIFSWTILLQFIPVVLVKEFSFTSSNIGDFAIFIGICWAAGSGHIKQFLIEQFSSRKILLIGLCLFSITLCFVTYPTTLMKMMYILGFSVFLGGMIWPVCTSIISMKAPPEMQGKILSISQSFQALAITLSGIVGGLAFQKSLHFPFIIASFAAFTSLFIFLFFSKPDPNN